MCTTADRDTYLMIDLAHLRALVTMLRQSAVDSGSKISSSTKCVFITIEPRSHSLQPALSSGSIWCIHKTDGYSDRAGLLLCSIEDRSTAGVTVIPEHFRTGAIPLQRSEWQREWNRTLKIKGDVGRRHECPFHPLRASVQAARLTTAHASKDFFASL